MGRGGVVTRRLSPPLWAKAPTALFRWRGVVAGLATASAVLAVASGSGPLFLSSAGSAALHKRLTPLSPSTAGLSISMQLAFPTTHRLQPATGSAGPPIQTSNLLSIQEARLRQLASRTPELGNPILSIIGPPIIATNPLSGQTIELRPVARSDFVSHVVVGERVHGGGLWIPESSADALGTKPGDSVRLSSDSTVVARVKGTYRSLATAPLEPYWTPLAKLIVPPRRPFPGSEPPALALGDLQTIERLAGRMKWLAEARWELPLVQYGLTLSAARGLSARIGEVADGTKRATFGDGHAVFANAGFFEINDIRYTARRTSTSTTAIHGVVQLATKTITVITFPVQAISVLGILVSLALMATAGFYNVHRRETEFRLLAVRGFGRVSTALRAALESLIPAALANALMVVLAYQVLDKWAGSVDASDLTSAIERVTLAAAVGLAVFGGSVAVAADRLLPLPPRRFRWRAAFTDILLIAVTAGSMAAMAGQGRITGVRPTVDLAVVVLPLVVLAAGATLLFRYIQRVLRGVRYTRARSRLPLYLALRRLTNQSVLAVVLATAGAVAVGLLVYTNMLVSSGKATMYAKSHVFVGSDAKVYVNDLGYRPDLAVPATTVIRVDNVWAGEQEVDILGIDRSSFSATAYWDDSFSSAPLTDLVARLDPARSNSLPAIVAGSSGPIDQLLIGEHATEIDVVARTTAFPGMLGEDPLVVVDKDPLVRELREPGGSSSSGADVWAKGAVDDVLRAMAEAGLAVEFAITAQAVASSPTLLALGWTLSTLRALGYSMGLLALGGLLPYLAARQRARLLSYALMRRMGLSSAIHRAAVVIEVASTLLGAVLAGTGLGVVSAVLLHEVIDLLPDVPPDPLLRFPAIDIALAMLGSLLAAVLGAWALQRAAERMNVAEVLRASE